MRHLLPTFLFSIALACLVACGGDDPVPPTPVVPTPSDTAMVDTAVVDTTDSDTTDKKKPFFCEYLPPYGAIGAELYENGNVYLSDLPFSKKNGKKLTGRSETCGEWVYYNIQRSGYVGQKGVFRPWHDREVLYYLHPMPTNGKTIPEFERSAVDVELCNEDVNREITQLEAYVRLPKDCNITGVNRNADSLSVTVFWPAGSPMDELGEVKHLSAGIAGVTLLPFNATFSKDVDIRLRMPMDIEAYGLEIQSPAGGSSVEAIGRDIFFSVRSGEEWTVMMGADIIDIETEKRIMGSGTMHSEMIRSYTTYDPRPLYMAALPAKKGHGFEAETELNFVEERFLTSLFGPYGSKTFGYGCHGNYPFTVEYNLVQEVHHITFEAGGRRFRAALYGFAYMEVVKAIPDKEE